MNLKLKAFGLALIAAFAMSAVAASGASADLPEADTAAANVTVTGEDTPNKNDIFTASDGGEITCGTSKVSGTSTDGASVLTVTPSWENCTIFGFATAHVQNTGCHYEFALTTNGPPFLAGAKLKCPTGHIVVTATSFGSSVCTLTFAEDNSITGDLTITNTGGAGGHGANAMDIDVHGTLSTIGYTVTTDHSFACQSPGNYNGSYDAKGTTVRAYAQSDAAHTTPIDVTIK